MQESCRRPQRLRPRPRLEQQRRRALRPPVRQGWLFVAICFPFSASGSALPVALLIPCSCLRPSTEAEGRVGRAHVQLVFDCALEAQLQLARPAVCRYQRLPCTAPPLVHCSLARSPLLG